LGNDRNSSVRFVSHHAPAAMFTRELTAFEVERVPVAVSRWVSEYSHTTVFFDPSHLNIVRDIAPDKVSAHTIPGRAFGPECAEMHTPDDRVAHDVPAKAIIQRDDIRIRILNGVLPVPVADGRG